MKVNVFEGARRISMVIGALWVLGCLAYAVFSKPYASVTYAIAWPGARATLTQSCSDEDAHEFLPESLPSGDSIYLNLCFTAQKADDGRMLVPYKAMPRPVAATAPGAQARKADDGASFKVTQGMTVEDIYQALRDADAQGDTKRAKEIAAVIDALPAAVRPQRYWMNERFNADVRAYTTAAAKEFRLSPEGISEAQERVSSARVKQWQQAGITLVCGIFGGWLFIACIGWIVRGFMGIPRGQDSRPSQPA
ncbi:hypothetical protein ABIC83_002838 [Roseateles asaccharophilus]|uniref:hypothetical protein n=1 Tax=Roseateles asaccharophilus TaxID=582607 RepID=UPI00383608D6